MNMKQALSILAALSMLLMAGHSRAADMAAVTEMKAAKVCGPWVRYPHKWLGL
jgi:hypothetical protein